MDRQFTNSFGRVVRVVAAKDGAFIQIKNAEGRELAAAALTNGDLMELSNMVRHALSIVD